MKSLPTTYQSSFSNTKTKAIFAAGEIKTLPFLAVSKKVAGESNFQTMIRKAAVACKKYRIGYVVDKSTGGIFPENTYDLLPNKVYYYVALASGVVSVTPFTAK